MLHVSAITAIIRQNLYKNIQRKKNIVKLLPDISYNG